MPDKDEREILEKVGKAFRLRGKCDSMEEKGKEKNI